MATPPVPESGSPPWITRVPSYAGVAVVVIAGLILLGWIRDFRELLELVPSLPATKANTTIAFIAAGASLIGSRGRRPLRWLAVVPVVIGAATLATWTGVLPTDIDQLVVDDPFTEENPGRPSPQLSAALLVFGVASLASGSARRAIAWCGAAATVVFVVVALTLELGFMFRSPELTSAGHTAGMSLVSAACTGLLAASVLALHASNRPLCYLWDRGPAGTVTRRLLPAVVLAPPALGLLGLVGQDQGWYGLHLGVTLFAGSMVILLAGLVTVTAQSLHALEDERLLALQEAAEATVRFRTFLDSAPDATIIADADGIIRYANHQVADLLGYPPEDLIDQPLEVLLPASAHERHILLRAAFAARPIRRQMGTDHDLTALHRDGRAVPVEVSLGPVETSAGTWISAAIRDVTARREAETALRQAEQLARHLAEHDPLTGVWNRRRFEQELVELLADGGDAGALMIVDIDHFKSVNDTAGHDAGDRLLVAVAEHLGRCSSRASVSRLGGDEFAVLLHRGDLEEVEEVAAAVVAAVRAAAESCQLGPGGAVVSASVGVAPFARLAPDDRSARSVMICADEALYVAKRSGRGRAVIYDASLSDAAPSDGQQLGDGQRAVM